MKRFLGRRHLSFLFHFLRAGDWPWRDLPSPSCRVVGGFSLLLLCGMLLAGPQTGFGQISPAEIVNPRLKAAEKTYFPQLQALSRAIRSTEFPFTFFLSRYVGLDPQKQAEADTRGLEFVKFRERVVLKITGNYNAAYNADLVTQNERASRTFDEVILPILQLVAKEIPGQVTCDAIGFEVSYHVRRRNQSYDYEGKEILVVVFDKADAWGYFNLPNDSARQDVLNRSEIFLNGKEFGLALGAREPFAVEALEKSIPHKPDPASSADPAETSNADNRLSRINQDVMPGFHKPDPQTSMGVKLTRLDPLLGSDKAAQAASGVDPSPANAENLQGKYKAQLDALAEEGVAKFHFVDYAPPSFVIFQKRIVLQVTIRNPLRFEKESSSIYKRAAQTFDLFLAPQVKSLLDRLPRAAFDALDVAVLNELASTPKRSSEAVEFICPLERLRQFVEAEITNQELINQSVVLVNGERIALNLQQVE